jgi:hypothetical protein
LNKNHAIEEEEEEEEEEAGGSRLIRNMDWRTTEAPERIFISFE